LEGQKLAEKIHFAKTIHMKGELDSAESLYWEIIAAVPDCSDAYNFLGILQFEKGDSDQAEQFIRKSISLQPDVPGPYNNLANILRTAGRLEEAIELYARATELAPEDDEIRENHEKAVIAQKQTDDALEAFRSAVELNPDAVEVYKTAFHSMYAEGRPEETAEVFRRWLEHDPDNATARHMLAATLGEDAPDRASEAYVTETFDGFADTFDHALKRLKYDVPRLVVNAVEKYWVGPHQMRAVLDAGCGTGLCGPTLKPLTPQLVGVDLSSKMLMKAADHEVYDQLIRADLTQYLLENPEAFDVIVAADTLVYFGDLLPVLKAGSEALCDGGLWVFSLEELSSDQSEDFTLNPSGRYAHSEGYVTGLATKLGLKVETHDSIIARTERGKPVVGVLVVLRKDKDLPG